MSIECTCWKLYIDISRDLDSCQRPHRTKKLPGLTYHLSFKLVIGEHSVAKTLMSYSRLQPPYTRSLMLKGRRSISTHGWPIREKNDLRTHTCSSLKSRDMLVSANLLSLLNVQYPCRLSSLKWKSTDWYFYKHGRSDKIHDRGMLRASSSLFVFAFIRE